MSSETYQQTKYAVKIQQGKWKSKKYFIFLTDVRNKAFSNHYYVDFTLLHPLIHSDYSALQ